MKCALVNGNAYGSKQDACHIVMFSSMACRVKVAIVQVARDSAGCRSSLLARMRRVVVLAITRGAAVRR
jgi:hypothetical protein